MEGCALKLIMEKGPREGETLDCRPGSVIRLGRVVKGNTLCIKDAGISSKHLLINFDDGNWMVSDLETSNGTLLNDLKIRPWTPFHLRDGDVIKIGEYTSIRVCIEHETKEDLGLRKNVRKAAVKVEVVDGFDAGNVENRPRRNPRRVAASQRTVAVKEEPVESASDSVPDVPKASEKPAVEPGNGGGTESAANVVENRTKRGRPRKNRTAIDLHVESVGELYKITESLTLGQEICQGPDNMAPLGEKQRRQVALKRTRALKGSEPSDSFSAASLVQVPENLNSNQENIRHPVNVDSLEGSQTDTAFRVSTKASQVGPSVLVPGSEAEMIPEGSSSKVENCKESLNESTVRESFVHVNDGLDLENMTLGEWFDYMELHLPKHIYETTEEMILGIRERAKQFHEFMSQQQNEKGKLPAA